MQPVLEKLTTNIALSGCIPDDVSLFLHAHGLDKTIRHSADVAALSLTLAERFELDGDFAIQAGWLHDISAVIQNTDRGKFARELGLAILPEEQKLPMILHQKLSRVFAYEIFGIHNTAVLDAVECHTTLKHGAQPLDKVIFVADKLAWDQPDTPPYADEMNQALDQGLDAAARVYLMYLWKRRQTLAVIHPWLVAAVNDLCYKKVEGQ